MSKDNDSNSFSISLSVEDLPNLEGIIKKYNSEKEVDSYKVYNSITEIPKNGIVLFLDTTGDSYKRDSIFRITALKYRNFKQIDYFDTYINIGNEITAINECFMDIDFNALSNAPNIKDVLNDFIYFIEDYPIVWHTNFKRSFIGKSLKDNNLEMIENNFFTTIKKARELVPELKHYGLNDLVNYFDIYVDNSESYNNREIFTCFQLVLELHEIESNILKGRK